MTQAVSAPINACPVAPLALEALRLLQLIDTADRTRAGEGLARLTRQLENLDERASRLVATSRIGLFYQALVGYGAIELISDWAPGEPGAGGRGERMARGCLLSLAANLRSVETEPLLRWYARRLHAAGKLAA